MPRINKKSEIQKQKEAREKKAKQREDASFCATEQAANTIARRVAREDPVIRVEEQLRDTEAHRVARENPVIRVEEQLRDTEAHRVAREDPVIRVKEQLRDTEAHRVAREDPVIRVKEQLRDTEAHRVAREDPTIRTPERIRDSQSRRVTRKKNPTIRTPEKVRDSVARSQVRRNPKRRLVEQESNSDAHRKRSKLLRTTYDKLRDAYCTQIRNGPSYICSCCGGLWYIESTSTTSEETLKSKGYTANFIDTILQVQQEQHRFCSTCKISVRHKKVPRLCLANGMDFPKIPEQLKDLSPLEERLVALRLPFMQIRAIGSERQSFLRGNVVNVENDLDVCIKALPRKFNETSTVQVQLMRRMHYKSPYMYETIRPHKVYKAAEYLIKSELYERENVLLSEHWKNYQEDDTLDFVCDDIQPDLPEDTGELDNQPVADTATLGAEETLIFRENDLTSTGIRIAPGEGKVPVPLFIDLNAEVLSFPSIYCGLSREIKNGVRISYTDIAKSELRRYDRRACRPDKLLYSFKRSFNEKVSQAVQVCMRKRPGSTTAGSVRRPDFIENLLKADDGYAVFKNLRSSPSYWKEKTKKVIAMVRQLGKCSFFITLSAAETKWTELIVMLMKIVKNKEITEDEAASLTFEEVASLIRSDPVTCMRHFDHRYRALLKLILKPEGGIFSPYKFGDFFSRLEFQMRGSPHSHGLYWIQDAPTYNENDYQSEKDCINFIDKFITCERSEEGAMSKLIGYQIHKHSKTCEKKRRSGIKCRFGFPKPPMELTAILQPLPNNLDPDEKKAAIDLYATIQEKLNVMGRTFKEDIPYDEFLEMFETTHMDYIFAVRSSIKRATVFLRRSTNAIFVNGYNRQLLEAWGANIDVQFVLDTYACAKYCVGYILKSEGGVSRLLQAATLDAQRGNSAVRDKLKKFANILISGSEISAQEAAGFLLGIQNTSCSRTDIFINTALPQDRIGFLKSQEELDKLSEDSVDVCAKGLVDHYTQRPDELDNICLAEFASMYKYNKSADGPTVNERINETIEEESEAAPSNLKVTLSDRAEPSTSKKKLNRWILRDSSGFIRLRTIRKIIRFRHYGRQEDPNNYFREQLMLFVPWRNEETELINTDPIQLYDDMHQVILQNSKPFYANRDIDDEILGGLVNEADSVENHDEDEDVDNEMGLIEDTHFSENDHTNEMASGSRVEQFLIPRLIGNPEYFHTMRTLNEKQRRIVLHILNQVKTVSPPFYIFLSGGAGVGKSHGITAIVQSLLRYDAKTPTTSPDQSCVLVGAPTGKAAFNVFGMTLHCAFKLPPNQFAGKLGKLDDGAVNTLRLRLANIKLFIIDEISMVSVRQLYDIDQRLREIYCSSEDFGGRSILVVGHLRQLPPVAGSYVFASPSHMTLGACVGNHLWEKFQLYELDEIMRQKGQLEFCKALNNMSEGCMDAADIELVKSREITPQNQPPEDAIYLFGYNDECQRHNALVHSQLQTEGSISIAFDKVQGSGSESEKRNLLDMAKGLSAQQSDGLPYKVQLQVGGIYFISTNVDVQDGLFNGSTGTLKMIEYGSTAKDERVPKRAWMDFNHSLIGVNKRSAVKSQQVSRNINSAWVPIDRITRNLSKTQRHKNLQLIRNQIPLVAANGMTIHKSQGSSLPSVVLCVKPSTSRSRKLTREKLYVACSRATSLEGLFVDGDFKAPAKPKDDDPVTTEMTRLRKLPLKFEMKFLQDYGNTFEKIYFHNVQSFLAHHTDVSADPCAMGSDILAFVEPHLLASDQMTIAGFNTIHRTNCRGIRNSEGALLLSKINEATLTDSAIMSTGFSPTGHYLALEWKLGDTTVVMLYKSPKYSDTLFLKQVAEILRKNRRHIIMFGDINIDLRKPVGKKVLDLFASFKLESKLDVNSFSTDSGTHIDCCFSNVDNLEAWRYESYYSYHKPICIAWPKA